MDDYLLLLGDTDNGASFPLAIHNPLCLHRSVEEKDLLFHEENNIHASFEPLLILVTKPFSSFCYFHI